MAPRRIIIAVVDDDAGFREAMRRVLTAFGFVAELYASAEEFLGSPKTTEAVCLIADLQLGGMSGVDLARRLSGLGIALPIIFMSGSDDEMLLKKAMQLSAVAFLQKPVPVYLLIEAIEKAVAQKPA